MSEEVTPVEGDGSQTPTASEAAPPQSEKTPAESQAPAVHPARLRQEARARRQAETVAQQTQQQLAEAQAKIAALEVQHQADPQPNSQAEVARRNLRAQVGSDEAGDKAMEMFDAYGEVIRAETSGTAISQEDVDRMINERATQIVDQRMGQHTQQERATMNVVQRLHGWVEKGSLTGPQAARMRQRFDEISAESPHVLTPTNSHAVLSNLFTEALDNGEVAAFSPSAPKPPVAPSPNGSGPPPAPEEEPEVVDPSRHPMQALRNAKPEEIRRIREQSIARHQAAQGG